MSEATIGPGTLFAPLVAKVVNARQEVLIPGQGFHSFFVFFRCHNDKFINIDADREREWKKGEKNVIGYWLLSDAEMLKNITQYLIIRNLPGNLTQVMHRFTDVLGKEIAGCTHVQARQSPI